MRLRLLAVVLLLALASTGCTRFDVLNALVPARNYKLARDLPYGDQPRQKLDVFTPKNLKRPAPVVVFFYGGNWSDGSKADYRFVGQALSSRGFVAVLPDYRLSPNVTFPAFVRDGAAAVRWARDHAVDYGGDPAELFVMGHSAGSQIAGLLACDGRYLKAVGMDRSDLRGAVLMSAPLDFLPLKDPQLRAAFGRYVDDPRVEPITFVDGKEPPLLLLQGAKDEIVDPRNSVNMWWAVYTAGGEVRLIEYPDRGHAGVVLGLAWPFRWLAPVPDDVAQFVETHSFSGVPKGRALVAEAFGKNDVGGSARKPVPSGRR